MKKKVLLVGWRNSVNFGTNLQAIALYTVIGKKYDCGFFWQRRYLSLPLFVNKCVLKLRSVIRKKKGTEIDHPEDQLLNIRRCYDGMKKVTLNQKSEKRKILSDYDTFVIGSDQVWNPYHLELTYLLDFVPKGYNKCSYAASIGVREIPKRYHGKYRKYLRDFSYLSMREKTGAACMEKILKKPVDTVLDPTLLLTKEEWSVFAEGYRLKRALPDRYLLCYFVGDTLSYREEIEALSEKMNLPVVIIPMNRQDFSVKNGICVDEAGPKEFVKLLENATFICTDSFHMCAFAINFNKEFRAFRRFRENDAAGQNSRTDDLFSTFGLNCFYADDPFLRKTDYGPVNEKLERERERCVSKLYRAIENEADFNE